MEDLGESRFGNLDQCGAVAPEVPFKRERVVSPSYHRLRGRLACGSKAMARPLRPSPGDHFTLRYEQKADPRRRNSRKEDGVSERCHRRSLKSLSRSKRGAACWPRLYFPHTV